LGTSCVNENLWIVYLLGRKASLGGAAIQSRSRNDESRTASRELLSDRYLRLTRDALSGVAVFPNWNGRDIGWDGEFDSAGDVQLTTKGS
jgi:hypothetical protein